MESWCFDYSLDKIYVSNETISPSDSIIRTRNALMGWELKTPFSYDNSILVPSQESVNNPGFPEVGFVEVMRKQHPHDSMRNVVNNNANVGDIVSPSMVTSNVLSGDEDSSSKLSSSVVDSNGRESSLIDLKLGGIGDLPNCNSYRTALFLSSAESLTPAKRVRATSSSSQTAYCQVYGCNKDLSSSKDYHKRHKVCDAHSKSARVIVNGIEQRFCQQCSRFHLLAEFDDGKRSCRKRLAGHNQRRRKPQVGFGGSRNGRLLHSHTGTVGSQFQDTRQDILPRGPLHPEKHGTNGWGRPIKIENIANSDQKSTNTCINGHLEQKSLPPYLFEDVNQYPIDIFSRSFLQKNSLGSRDLTRFDTASTVEGLSEISESGCALSLLSSQPHSGLTNGVQNYSMSQVSEKLFGAGFTSEVPNRYPSYRESSTGRRNHLSSIPGFNEGDSINSDFANGILQGTKFVDANDLQLSCKDGTTIDLLQLSSQLHRVENQRQSSTVEQDNEDGFWCLRMT